MQRRMRMVSLGIVVLFLFSFVLGGNTVKDGNPESLSAGYRGRWIVGSQVHAPISILSDAAMDAFPNKTGAGTPADPYIIKDLVIDGGFDVSCIELKAIGRHVVIKNCTLFNSGALISDRDSGVEIFFCENITISNCTIRNNQAGIWCVDSRLIKIENNTLRNNIYHGIWLVSSSALVVKYNRIYSNTRHGLLLESTHSCTFTFNNCTSNGLRGIWFDSFSHDNTLYFNYFGSNVVSQAWDDGINNVWDDPIGNMYGDYTAKYPAATNDGVIWNTPYLVDGLAYAVDTRPVFDVSSDHLPILIRNNSELDAFCSGDGTTGLSWGAAHRIKDLKISAGGGAYCIKLMNIDRCLVIENCTLITAFEHWLDSAAILMYNCSNVRVTNCSLNYNTNGISCTGICSDCRFDNNTVNSNTARGIIVDASNNMTVYKNSISKNMYSGIYFRLWGRDNNISSNVLTGNIGTGVMIQDEQNTTMAGNEILDHAYASQIITSENLTLRDNHVSNTTVCGFYVDRCTASIRIESNNLTNAGVDGIFLLLSSGVEMISNKLVNTSILLDGNITQMASHAIDTTNTVNGKPVYYYHGQNGLSAANFTNAGQVITINCNSSTIADVNCSKASNGILVFFSSNVLVSGCTLSQFKNTGILLKQSTQSNMTGNRLESCSKGISIENCTHIRLRTNLFVKSGLIVDPDITQAETLDIDTSNTVNGRLLHYYVGQSGLTEAAFSNAGQIIMINCNDSRVHGQNVSHGSIGITGFYSHNNSFMSVDACCNQVAGVEMFDVNFNNITTGNFSGCAVGIRIQIANDFIITKNDIDDCITGLFLTSCLYFSIEENSLSGCLDYGVNIASVTANVLANNTISYSGSLGIYIYNGQYNILQGNTITHNKEAGIFLSSVMYSNITQNNIAHNGYGIFFYQIASHNKLFYNSFVENSLSNAYWYDYYGSNNTWFSDYEGNYWSDYATLHPNATNLGRTWSEAYAINGTAAESDPYPLVRPWALNQHPDATFTASPTSVETGQSVFFTHTGTNGNEPATYQWNFGDGPTNSTLQNPIHVYTLPGTYTVTLTVTDVDMDDTSSTRAAYISVIDRFPDANFTTSTTVTIAGQSVSFTHAGGSGNAPATYQWDFGDGTGNSTLQNPMHVYSTPGNFTVTLSVADVDGDIHVVMRAGIIKVLVYGSDADADGLSNGEEILEYGSDPFKADTDDDGIDDRYEVENGLEICVDDASGDKDGDGLDNITEFRIGTRADKADTDGDGFSDKGEVEWRTDPLVALSSPLTYYILPVAVVVAIALSVTPVKIKQKKLKIKGKSISNSPDDWLDRQIERGAKSIEEKIDEKRAILSRVMEPQTADEQAAMKNIVGPGKLWTGEKKKDPIQEEMVTHQVDAQTESEVDVFKKKELCIVCNTTLKATTYICPNCETKYCIRCAIALSEQKETCWVCKNPLNFSA